MIVEARRLETLLLLVGGHQGLGAQFLVVEARRLKSCLLLVGGRQGLVAFSHAIFAFLQALVTCDVPQLPVLLFQSHELASIQFL